MQIKETPTNVKVYYNSMRQAITQKRNEAIDKLDKLNNTLDKLYKTIRDYINVYKNEFNIDLLKYPEYVNNSYSTGEFYKVAKGLFINRSNNYRLVSDLFDLYKLAKTQKQIYDITNSIKLYDKLLNLSIKDYTETLRTYMTEVHKQLVLEGNGYLISGEIGWICVNRCLIEKSRPKLDYAATRRNKQELIAQGKRLYNKQEADWCRRNGIEYNGVDYRVYINKEYCYEIPLLNCKLPEGTKHKLEIADYRHNDLRGKTNEELIKDCKSITSKICELPIDLRTKLTLCDTTDKILYTKFIRNENQEPSTTTKANRKNR